MGFLSHWSAVVLTVFFGPLLPERSRHRWPWSDLLRMDGIQSAHGFLWAVLGVIFWAWGFVLYQAEMSDLVASLVTDERGSGDVGPITHYGLIFYFAFLVTPRGFLLTLLLLDGVVRAVAGGMAGSVPGSLYLAVPLAAGRLTARAWHAARMTSRYGKADEPDRLLEEGDRLRVLRTRPHPEWNADQAFRFGERLYQLHNYNPEAFVRGRLRFEYTFTPWPEGRTLRRVLAIGPPGDPPARLVQAQEEDSPQPS